MEPFNKCPRCGDVDVRRTRCACGYGADGLQATPPAPARSRVDDAPAAAAPAPAVSETGLRERLIGLALFASGAALAYACVYEPLQAAAREAESISVSVYGSILCPVALVMGVLYLILGHGATRIFGTREQPKPAAWVSAVVLLLAGLGLYFYVRSALAAQGYQF